MKNHKRYALAVGIIFAVSSLSAISQQPAPVAPGEVAHQARPKVDLTTPEGITAHEHQKYQDFIKAYALTAEQQPKVKAVLDNRLAEELANLSNPPEARQKRLVEINAEAQSKMRAILDDIQRAKYNKALQDEYSRHHPAATGLSATTN
ncbi:MAG: hypothetical protein P4L10_03305 [Acidobacteriaceae bacterium]|nr:hypothetical protein [Acidobacteriaceae bacterium]